VVNLHLLNNVIFIKTRVYVTLADFGPLVLLLTAKERKEKPLTAND
jgi:hypothetical protein